MDSRVEDIAGGYIGCRKCSSVVSKDGTAVCPAGGPHEAMLGVMMRRWLKHSAMRRAFRPQSAEPFPDYENVELAGDDRDARQEALAGAYRQYVQKIPAATLNQVNQNGGLRKSYRSLSAATFATLLGSFRDSLEHRPEGQDEAVWSEVGKQLIAETDAARIVNDFYDELQTVFQEIFFDMSLETSEVQKIFEGALTPKPGPNWFDFAFGIVEALLGAVPGLGESIGKIAEVTRAVVEIVEEVTRVSMEAVEAASMEGEDPSTMVDAQQWRGLRKRFDQQMNNLVASRELVLSDWGSLQAIQAANLEIKKKATRDQLKKSWVEAYRIRLYQQLMSFKFYLAYAFSPGANTYAFQAFYGSSQTTHRYVISTANQALFWAIRFHDNVEDWSLGPTNAMASLPPR